MMLHLIFSKNTYYDYNLPLQTLLNDKIFIHRFSYKQYELYNYNTPLHNACEYGMLEEVKILTSYPIILKKSSLATNDKNYTPLQVAFAYENMPVIEYLLSIPFIYENEINNDINRIKIMNIVCKTGNIQILKYILSFPLISENVFTNVETCKEIFYNSCISLNLDLIKFMIKLLSSIFTDQKIIYEIFSSNTNNPLTYIVEKDHFETFKFLFFVFFKNDKNIISNLDIVKKITFSHNKIGKYVLAKNFYNIKNLSLFTNIYLSYDYDHILTYLLIYFTQNKYLTINKNCDIQKFFNINNCLNFDLQCVICNLLYGFKKNIIPISLIKKYYYLYGDIFLSYNF